MIRFGTDYYAGDYPRFLETVRVGEAIGLDLIGHGDSQCLWADPYVSLSAAAMVTERVRLGPLVTNPITRHPSVTAASVASLDRLSGGRAVLGLGAGDSAVLNIGQRPARIREFVEHARAIRELLRGEPATIDGQRVQLTWLPSGTSVPVFFAAEGPRKLELAGMYADGVVVSNGLTREVIEDTIEHVHRGAERARRDPDEVEIWWMVNFQFAPSVDEGSRELAWLLAASADHVFRHTLEGKRVPAEHRDGVMGLMAEYSHAGHAVGSGKQHNGALVERHGLRAWLTERFAVTGSPAECRQRFAEIAGYGATNLLVTQHVPDPIALLERLGSEIIAPLTGRTHPG